MTTRCRLRSAHKITSDELCSLKSRLEALEVNVSEPLQTLSSTMINQALSHARGLLKRLPSDLDEVRDRSTPCSLFELRVALFCLIDSDQLGCDDADQLAPLFRVIGAGELEEPLSLWLEREWSDYQREASAQQLTRVERGLAALFHSARGHERFESMSEHDRVLFSGPWVRPMMRLAGRERFPKQALLALYRSTHPEVRDALLQQFERCRRRVHARPLPTYELLLPALTFAEFSLLLAYWDSHQELESIAPYMSAFSEEIQQMFASAIASERYVS